MSALAERPLTARERELLQALLDLIDLPWAAVNRHQARDDILRTWAAQLARLPGGAMKIRLHGTADECHQAAERLVGIVEVLAVPEPHADRGASMFVRVYVEAQIAPPVHVTSTSEARPRGRRHALPPGGACGG